MVVSCWSAKGGSGTTVVSAALALIAGQRSPEGVLLVDLAGDLPAALGMPEPRTPGVAEWLQAGADVPADGLSRLEVPATSSVDVLPRGAGPFNCSERVEVLAGMLAADPRVVIVDCGCLAADLETGDLRRMLAMVSTHSLLVTRPCYLAMRRVVRMPLTPSGVVLVNEHGRSLDRRSIEDIVGAPVVCEIPPDPAIARAVDAGMLATRLPRLLEKALWRAA